MTQWNGDKGTNTMSMAGEVDHARYALSQPQESRVGTPGAQHDHQQETVMDDTTHATENQDAQVPAPILPEATPATGDQDEAPSTSDQGDEANAQQYNHQWVPHYQAHCGYLYRVNPDAPDGPQHTRLTNFVAYITRGIVEDDGVAARRLFEIEVTIFNQPPFTVTIPTGKFAGLEWVLDHPQAEVTAGPGMREHVGAAIRHISHASDLHVYAHTGWREVDGQWVYLHAGGAIGRPGLITDVKTCLPGKLGRYRLPAPLGLGEPLRQAVRRVLALLDVAPDRIMVPLLGATFRAVLGLADFSLHLHGRTGGHKTGLAALCQQFFGAEMDERHLPSDWISTGNVLERLASQAKNALFVVDDFVPSAETMLRDHGKADRVLRAQGNASERQRMTADGRVQASAPQGKK